jgi:hypothetical protein
LEKSTGYEAPHYAVLSCLKDQETEKEAKAQQRAIRP